MSSSPSRTFEIAFQFPTPMPNMEKLAAEIMAFGDWWHCMDTIWIVKTTHEIDAIREKLRKRLRSDDVMLITEVAHAAAWAGLKGQAASWLKDNIRPRGTSPQARGFATAEAF